MAGRRGATHHVPAQLRAEEGGLLRLTHVRLLVEDVDRLATFYRDVMGFDLVVDAEPYKEFVAGDARLGLYKRDLMAERLGMAGRVDVSRAQDHVCLTFQVDDVDRVVAELSSRGAEVATAPHDEQAWFLRVAHLRDPEGNLLEINAPLNR